MLGRQEPALKAGLLFRASDLAFLADYACEYALGALDSLGAAMQFVAHFGGYRGRMPDRAPGHQTIWMGSDKRTTVSVGCLVASKRGRIRKGED